MALNILIVDDEVNIRKTLALALEVAGHQVTAVGNAREAVAQASARPFDLIFLDVRLGQDNGVDIIPDLIATCPWVQIVIITAHGTLETAVEAMKRGASDFLPKPFTPGQVQGIASRLESARPGFVLAKWGGEAPDGGEPALDLQSQSPAMQQAFNLARQVAPTEAVVLLRGESGTGKSVLARLIHAWSARASKPFGTLSCPSLSPELLESELFGHMRGAFTGALRDTPGRIASLDGGTLFLDEVGELPLAVQAKLLRFLQERQYERLGESQTRKANLRVIAATNAPLEEWVAAGKFREDLLYRLNVFPIELPPLRNRREDLPLLAHRFLGHFAHCHHRQFLGFDPEALSAIQAFSWPGNVRELRNKLERASILARGPQVTPADLGLITKTLSTAIQVGAEATLDQLEEAHIRQILASQHSLETAARILGIDAATLWRKRKKYGL